MDHAGGTGQSLYPLHRTKTLHLVVRHAEGHHNVAIEKAKKMDPKDKALFLSSDQLFDAQLTPLGWKQVENLRKHVQETGLSKRLELVIASPMSRTMQTALGVFGSESGHPPITSPNSPPFIAVELCRELSGVRPHEKRRSISEYKTLFPQIDFSLIESDEDILWKPDFRETKEEIVARGLKFLNWLWTRKEQEIAIVTHYVFLLETLKGFGTDCHPFVTSEIRKMFVNCELRSLVIVDKSLIGSQYSSTTNYLGKVPQSLLPDKGSAADMDATTAGQSLYPLHRTKTIHLVRHAQGFHNVAGEKDHTAYLSYDLLDAQLTPLGWTQVDNLQKHVQACGLSKKIELVIVSPLLRTMQTAVGVFGGGAYADGINVPPLMVANAGSSERPAITSLNCPPFIAVEQCREHLGVHPCDKRRSISEYRALFPAIDFSLLESDEDILWTPDVREKNEEVAARGLKFLDWLWTREEKEIAIVTHSGYLYHTLGAFGNDCHPTVKSEICTHFANCELRSMVLIDRSSIGSDSSTTNYPGKIPHGLDLPSDVAEEKHPEKGAK